MKYLPIEKHKFTTSLPNVEVSRRLTAAIGPAKRTPPGKAFTGSIHGYKFTITRIIDYRNSFVPKISGQIIPFPGGTEIETKMNLHPSVIVFMSFWLGVVGLASLAVIIYLIIHIGEIFSGRLNAQSFMILIPID